MKIFVVIEQWVCESGEDGVNVETFKTEEKAKEYMEELIQNTEDMGYDKDEYGENTFSAWTDGEYHLNHTNIILEEKEVK